MPAGAVSLRKSHDIVALSFWDVVKGRAKCVSQVFQNVSLISAELVFFCLQKYLSFFPLIRHLDKMSIFKPKQSIQMMMINFTKTVLLYFDIYIYTLKYKCKSWY